MKLSLAHKPFFSNPKDNQAHIQHFLLDAARIKIKLTFDDNSVQEYECFKRPDKNFEFDMNVSIIPKKTDGKIKIPLTMKIEFFITHMINYKIFNLLTAIQLFSITINAIGSDGDIKCTLNPTGWIHSDDKNKSTRTSNLATHPLLDLSKLSIYKVFLKSLILDITELWLFLHEKNIHYQIYGLYQSLFTRRHVAFRVFAHLGGNPFIWFAVIPRYLVGMDSASAHVFYAPSDYGFFQNKSNDKSYLLDNAKEFEAGEDSNSAYNGEILMNYVLPPIDDVVLSNIKISQKFTDDQKNNFESILIKRRNVVNFFLDKNKKIQLLHWQIPAGFERSFYISSELKPQQFLLFPQRTGSLNSKGQLKKISGWEIERHLNEIVDSVGRVLQSNSDLFLKRTKRELFVTEGHVLSCYSESGNDLWKSSEKNIDFIKAIIAVEPNNTNTLGRKALQKLIDSGISIFYIGQHNYPHYHPKVTEGKNKIRYLPDDPTTIFRYPPLLNDPKFKLNDFVKFRVSRVGDISSDLFLLPEERVILEYFAKRKPPIVGDDAITKIFDKRYDSYDQVQGNLSNIYYSHNFCLTGGQLMILSDKNSFYGKDFDYMTFFQQSVVEIG